MPGIPTAVAATTLTAAFSSTSFAATAFTSAFSAATVSAYALAPTAAHVTECIGRLNGRRDSHHHQHHCR